MAKSNSIRQAISNSLRFAILERDHFKCRYCGCSASEKELYVDHVIPIASGGGNDPTNLVTACFECNSGKGGSILQKSLGNNHTINIYLIHPDMFFWIYDSFMALFPRWGYIMRFEESDDDPTLLIGENRLEIIDEGIICRLANRILSFIPTFKSDA